MCSQVRDKRGLEGRIRGRWNGRKPRVADVLPTHTAEAARGAYRPRLRIGSLVAHSHPAQWRR